LVVADQRLPTGWHDEARIRLVQVEDAIEVAGVSDAR